MLLTSCLRRELREATGLVVDVCELLSAYPFEVIEGRWVNVVVYGCELRDPNPPTTLHASGEHAMVAFKRLADLSRQRLPDGYRNAVQVWQARRAMSHG